VRDRAGPSGNRIGASRALAGAGFGLKAPGADMIASVTFIAILMTILIQAPTTKWLGSKLGLLEESKSKKRRSR